MNIVLIGYRGTGKSSVGKLLSAILDMELVEMDRLIVRKAGLSIPEIVKRSGWEVFRDIESEVAKEILQKDNCVIDSGGGVVLREENVECLKTNGLVFWLKAGKETIVARIKDSEERPSLTGTKSFVEEVEEVLKAREPLYQAAADWMIETDKKSVEEITAELVKIMLQLEDLDDFKERLEKGFRKIEEIEQEA